MLGGGKTDVEMETSPGYFRPEDITIGEQFRRYGTNLKCNYSRLLYDGPSTHSVTHDIKQEADSMDSDHSDATHGKMQASVKLRLVIDGFSDSDLIADPELQTGTELLKACKMEDEYPDSQEAVFGLFASPLDCAIQGAEDPPEDLLVVQGLRMDTCHLLTKCASCIKTLHDLDDAPTRQHAHQLPDAQSAWWVMAKSWLDVQVGLEASGLRPGSSISGLSRELVNEAVIRGCKEQHRQIQVFLRNNSIWLWIAPFEVDENVRSPHDDPQLIRLGANLVPLLRYLLSEVMKGSFREMLMSAGDLILHIVHAKYKLFLSGMEYVQFRPLDDSKGNESSWLASVKDHVFWTETSVYLELHATAMPCLSSGECMSPDATVCTALMSALYSVSEKAVLHRQLMKIAEYDGKIEAGVYATQCNNLKHILPICYVHGLMPIPYVTLRSEISWHSVSEDIRSQSNERHQVLEDELMQQMVQLLLEEAGIGSLMWHGKGPAVPPKMKGVKDKDKSKQEPPKKGAKEKGNKKGEGPSKEKGEEKENEKDSEEEKEYLSLDDLEDLDLPYKQIDWTGETDQNPPNQHPHRPRLIKDQRDKSNIIPEIITSPVRDQGNKTSAVEAVMNLHRAEDDDTQWMTSSQELMDWVQYDLDKVKNSGLRRMYNVWNHVFKKKVSKEENYKYVGEPALEKERFALGVTIPERVVLRILGFEVIEPVDDERLLLRQLATMLVVASLEATPSFLDWKRVNAEDRKARRNKKVELHSILVVGYGKIANGLNYFLIRNSYGKGWGFKIRGANRRWGAKGSGGY
ncbi:unnamed protein product [Linum tenue]|uniref:Peptidase C1A papain C-terminal domain-containing protein n=1 Tax=Linum tenue TaxID=586396 RepID=A0AAV0KCU7_9ROSI|nr:unnamed protein product [Linum tenue]